MPPTGESPDTVPRGLIITFTILFIAIIGAGTLFYQSQEEQVADRVTSELSSIALLKVDQIAAWRGERLGDAEVLSQNRILIDGVREYLSKPDPVREQKIRNLFGQINTSYHYHNVQLVDREGRVKVSLDPADTVISHELDKQLAESLASRNAILTDFSAAADDRSPQMYVIAPLIVTDNGKTDVVGAVILTIDPAMDLYPLILSWPVPRETAEALLVEREGDHVLYLNELRHQHNTALNLTIPLSQTDLPAVKAVLGTTGALTGRDYRGVEVLSVLAPVPGSPWFMVAKIDTAEAYATWRSRSGLIIALVVGTLAGALVIIGLVWQRRQKYYYRSLYAAESGRREEEHRNRERLEILLRLSEMESATEQELADYVLDAGCRLTGSTLAFTGVMTPDESVFDITAWSKSVMKDCSVAASPIHFPIAKAGIWADAVRQRKPQVVNDYPAPLPGKKGLPAGHVPITRFVSIPIFEGQRIVMVCAVANKDADYTPLDVDNLTLLMQGVWAHLRKRKADEALREKTADLEAAYEEITASEEELKANYEELARNQQALKESRERFRNLVETASDMIWEVDEDTKYTYMSPQVSRVLGYEPAEILGKTPFDFMPPDEAGRIGMIFSAVSASREPFSSLENTVLHKHGRPVVVETSGVPFFRADGSFGGYRGIDRDITERKRAEAGREEIARQRQLALDAARLGWWYYDPATKIARYDKRYTEILGVTGSERANEELLTLLHPDDLPRVLAAVGAALDPADPKPYAIDYRVHAADGVMRWVRAHGIAAFGGSGAGRHATSFIGTVEDITDRKLAEEEIRSARAFLDMVIDMSPFPMWISDNTGTVTRVNRSLCKIIHLDADQIIGKYNVLRDANLEKQGVMPGVRAVFEEHSPARFSIPWKAAEAGDVDFAGARDMYIDVSLFPILNGRGELTHAVCQWVDVTERVIAEEKLRETNEYLQNLLDYANAPIIVWDPAFRITRFNHAFERLTGRSEQEVLGRHLDILFPEAGRDASLDLIRKTVEGERWETVEIPILHASGGIRIVLWNSANIVDAQGRIISTIAQGNDITARKEAEGALRESEVSYRVLAANLPGIVYRILLKEENRMIFFNDQLQVLSGYTPEGLMRGSICSIEPYIHPDDLPAVLASVEKAVADLSSFEVEYRFLHKDGKYRTFIERGRVMAGPDLVPLFIDGVIHDITDRRQAEELRERLIRELEQKNAELERFSYTVSHDLKSPIITIKGFAGLLEDDTRAGDPVQLRKDVQRITTAADTMQELLADVLELSRIGRVVSPPERIPFGTIAHEAVELIAGPLAERGVTVEIAPDLPVVSVDHARIREVMTNLIENAVKFLGDQPDPLIRIGVDRQGEVPVFFVQDNGIGIDHRYLDRIFNLFEKLDASAPGTGVGLTIVKRIIEVHGGKIWAESEGPGKGTTFRFTLPVAGVQ